LYTLATKKECLECFVDTAQRILQNLTVHRTNILSNGFDVWELVRLLDVVDAPAVRRPGLTPLLQGGVVQFSTHLERGLQFFSLRAIRVKAIFERSSCRRKRLHGRASTPFLARLFTALLPHGVAHIETGLPWNLEAPQDIVDALHTLRFAAKQAASRCMFALYSP